MEEQDKADNASKSQEQDSLLSRGSSRRFGRLKCCRLPGQRYILAAMCSIGFAIILSIRGSIGVATEHFRDQENATVAVGADHDSVGEAKPAGIWTASMIGSVEAAYFWGFCATQLPGGMIASRLSATLVFGCAILCSSFLSLILPVAMQTSFAFAMVVRTLQGLVDGSAFPSNMAIWRRWAPPLERSILANISICGFYFGAFLGLMLSGVLAKRFGWTVPFYVYGISGIVWFIIWLLCTSDKPSNHPCITKEEADYIEQSIGENMDNLVLDCSIPWSKFFTSLPVIAVYLTTMADGCVFHLMVLQPVKYFGDVYKFDSEKGGILSGIPHLLMAFVAVAGGWVADCLRKRWLSTVIVRKIFVSLGLGIEAAFLLGTGYATDSTVATVCFIIAVSMSTLGQSGHYVNILDLAPRYAGILMGLSYCIVNVGAGLVVLIAAFMVEDKSRTSWSHVFLMAALLEFACLIFFLIFASGEKQQWAMDPQQEELEKPGDVETESDEAMQ